MSFGLIVFLIIFCQKPNQRFWSLNRINRSNKNKESERGAVNLDKKLSTSWWNFMKLIFKLWFCFISEGHIKYCKNINCSNKNELKTEPFQLECQLKSWKWKFRCQNEKSVGFSFHDDLPLSFHIHKTINNREDWFY